MSEEHFKVTLQRSHEKLFVLPGKLLLAWDAKGGSEVYVNSEKEGARIKVEEPRAELAERFNLLSFDRYGWLQRPFSMAPSALIN